MVLCRKFGRFLLSGGTWFRFLNDSSKLSTTASLLYSAPTAVVPVRLPAGYNAPTSFSLFVKEQLTGQTGGTKNLKIVSESWKNLTDDVKQHYVESAKKVGDEKRDKFEKLQDYQKRELIENHAKKTAKLQRYRRKKILHKFHADTNRPKHPLVSYMIFAKERLEKHASTLQTKEDRVRFAKEMGEQWRQMSELEKKTYVDQARSNLATYHQQVAEWQRKYENEIQEWREANEPKKKTTPKGKKRKKKAATAESRKKKEGGSLSPKKGHSINSGIIANKRGEETIEAKMMTSSAKKVKKAEVKGAVD